MFSSKATTEGGGPMEGRRVYDIVSNGRVMRPQIDEDTVAPDGVQQQARASVSPRSTQRISGLRRVLADPRLALQLLNAQLRLRRRAQLPFSVRLLGRARAGGGGRIVFGDRVRLIGTMVPVEFVAHPGGSIAVGDGTFINYGVSVSAHELVSIGRDCSIGQYAIINDNDYHDIEDHYRLPPAHPVVLEDRVWLGARVIVLRGVRIGHDSAIGAGSVVTKDIPPRSVAAGVPARVLRQF
jgi:acetyltransferase-like isoleucine patch superfamily enzyme